MADFALVPGTTAIPGFSTGLGRLSWPRLRRPARDVARLEAANLHLGAENERLRQQVAQLERMSRVDPLTGLLNRSGFNEALCRTLTAAQRHDDGGALAYIDCDAFKSVNDTWGHQAGDAVLAAIGDILRRDTRSTDYIARLHGDEFAVLLVRSGMRLGTARLRLMEHAINNSTVLFGQHEIRLRVSMGIVAYDGSSSVEDMIRRADRAMYDRKQVRRVDQPMAMAAE